MSGAGAGKAVICGRLLGGEADVGQVGGALHVRGAIAELEVFYPDTFVAQDNILYTSLTYTNMIVHPVGSVLNMGRIEWTHGQYRFYWEGLTPGVCRNMDAVEADLA